MRTPTHLLLLWSTAATTALAKSEYKDGFRYQDATQDPTPERRLNPAVSKDPWYTPEAGWESTAPGDVLRTRPQAYDLDHPGFEG